MLKSQNREIIKLSSPPGQRRAGQELVTVIMSGGPPPSALWSATHKYRDTEIQVNRGNIDLTSDPGRVSHHGAHSLGLVDNDSSQLIIVRGNNAWM